ncbi:actin-related protein 8 [Chloropicon primus]|uniref:Actin-related protein 8 n=2 Tax=Chloropicon primus TaxID=1764295 RepID=A0A5B8MGU4_9CHLO|nr:actin-related protein 8 [Chloropicon primus]UPQ97779.1 actin-related protein 8 [Chloropicon primus]|eukprot:QDZ18570.1 actin-related protein 8 [Chloropicon primus]
MEEGGEVEVKAEGSTSTETKEEEPAGGDVVGNGVGNGVVGSEKKEQGGPSSKGGGQGSGGAKKRGNQGQGHDETHSALYAKAQKSSEYYRAMTVPDMVAERGEKIIVIHPGSQTLRIGVASTPDQMVEVPNCVAYRRKEGAGAGGSGGGRGAKRRRLGEDGDSTLADVGRRTIETVLGLSRASRKSGKVVEEPYLKNRKGESVEDFQSQGKAFLAGSEALEAAKGGGYDLHFCICAGHLHLHDEERARGTSLKERCSDIWSWAIEDRLKIDRKDLPSYSCVLVVSSVMDKREARDLVDVVLRDLEMKEVAVHDEAVAAIFTHACPIACVVNVDTEVTTVQCMEDGMCLSSSKLVLPYGRWDVFRMIKSSLAKHGCWPWSSEGGQRANGCGGVEEPQGYRGLGGNSVAEFEALDRIYSECCKYETEEEVRANGGPGSNGVGNAESSPRVTNRTNVVLRLGQGSGGSQSVEVGLGSERFIAPMGLYFPKAFGLSAEEKSRRCEDHTATSADQSSPFGDSVDELMFEALVQREDRFLTASKKMQRPEHKLSLEMSKPSTELPGIDSAIVASILGQEKPELKARLFQNIVLVGDGTCDLPGCVDMLESRVLAGIPHNETTVNTVNVAKPKVSPSESIFKGGALLGILDYIQENWIQRKEWVNGGIHAGTSETKRLYRLNKLTLQTLWHGVY